MIFENSNMELITTRQIYDSFLKKYAVLCGLPLEFLNRILKFRPICIGAPLVLKGCRFKFFYTFNLIPSLAFEAIMEKQSLYYAGDGIVDQDTLTAALKEGAISQDRFNQLNNIKWRMANFRMFIVGNYPWRSSFKQILKQFAN